LIIPVIEFLSERNLQLILEEARRQPPSIQTVMAAWGATLRLRSANGVVGKRRKSGGPVCSNEPTHPV